MTCMNPFVIKKIRRRSKAFITLGAFIVTLPSVNPSMNYQRVFPCKRLGALEVNAS